MGPLPAEVEVCGERAVEEAHRQVHDGHVQDEDVLPAVQQPRAETHGVSQSLTVIVFTGMECHINQLNKWQ